VSILFTPGTISEVKVKNRFVHSATHERMATRKGEIKEEIGEIDGSIQVGSHSL